MSALLNAALDYAANGWAVLPLEPNGKRPITTHGVKDATTDPDTITRFWTATPDANIGVATGAISAISVVDVDDKPGKDGYASLQALDVPDVQTPWQITPSGGSHMVFAYVPSIGNTVGQLGVGLDTRGDGGYIVVAPSVVDGRPYTWAVAPFNGTPFSPIPQIIIDRLKTAGRGETPRERRSTEEWLGMFSGVAEGSRQATLPSVVGKLYADNDPQLKSLVE